MAARAIQTSSGFWSFVAEQLARPMVHDGRDQREIAQEGVVLAYLRESASTEEDALRRLLTLGVFGPGQVRLAACRLYRRWQAREVSRMAVA